MARDTLRSGRKRRPETSGNKYNQRTLMHDREYGFYWYSWLWSIVRPLLILAISLLIVGGIIMTGWNYVNNHFFAPVDPENTQVSEFVIESGTSIASIGQNLQNEGYIRNSGIFKYIVQFQELTGKLQYGSYPLSPSMNVNEVIGILAQGSASNERQITIIPGWTVEDVADYLMKQNAITDLNAFKTLCNNRDAFKDNFSPLQEAIDAKAMSGRRYALEGYLAPDTYRVYTDAKPETILLTLLKQSETVYDQVFNQEPAFAITVDEAGNRLDDDGNIMTEDPLLFETTLTRDQTIILASLIEKEAGRTADFRKVAAVFHNRLQKNMKLESDASVSYALGLNRLILTNDELNTDSPFNTYKNAGLPAGPICNPSKNALIAALYPDMDYVYDEYLFFCTGDPAKGELVFSKTKEEHEAAVAQYRPLWREFDEKQSS
ncbi:endolytic transglycosylase MltG [Eubacteriales bacterium OttesenSCG-928-N13]|nr:endolytic transglycosylase MltG [Eubacteriales bacterium OttesenSCG-928-N13]